MHMTFAICIKNYNSKTYVHYLCMYNEIFINKNMYIHINLFICLFYLLYLKY